MDDIVTTTEQNDILEKTAKATERELLSMQSHKRYTVYQTLLEIHPQNGLSVEDCLKKAALYILKWMKDKVGAEEDLWPAGIKGIPTPEDWKDYLLSEDSPIADINIKEPVRVRTLYWDNCWTMRFNESNDGFDGVFENNISLTKEEKTLVLAISTECRQVADAKNKAVGLRPGYVSKMILDKDMYLTEKLSDGPLDDILKLPIIKEAVAVSGNGGDAEKLYKYIANPMRNFPLIFIPKPENEEALNLANSLYHDGTEEIDHHGVLGYYCTVYLEGDKWNKFLYCTKENTAIRQWIKEVIEAGRAVMLAPWDGTEGTLKFYQWDNEGGYIFWNENTSIEDCLIFNEIFVNKIKELKFSQEPVERRCNFGNYRFNRELWNEWNLAQIENARNGNNSEELISGQQLMIEEADKVKKALKEKLDNAERINEKLRADNQQLKKELSEANKKTNSDKTSINTATQKDFDCRLDEIREYLEKTGTEADCLFPAASEWSNVFSILRNEMLTRIYNNYKALFNARKKAENPTRREDILGILYCFNMEGSEFIDSDNTDILLYYPKNDQIYDNEYRNLVLDALWNDEDVFLNKLASDIEYDKKWREIKERNLLQKIDNYRQVKNIKSVLNQEGIIEISDNKHNKFSLGGDERYTYSIACTPRDRNTGKNTVDGFMERFF